jgi:predicted N-acetyltransferase YhbS
VDIEIRSLRDGDVAAAQLTAYHALRNAGLAYGWETPELDDAVRERGQRRIRHAARHDPDGAFVADRGGEVVGVSLATRRGPLWFLSLLAVATDVQSQGVGRRLLDASLTTFDKVGMLCASSDPKALRRYRRAGFDLVPAYVARGTVDRSLLPSSNGVREGAFDDDRDFVEAIASAQRGAPHGADLDFFAQSGSRLFVADSRRGRGYVVTGTHGVSVLGATSPEAAAAVLWTALAEAAEAAKPVELAWLSRDQQWAIDVALDARLSVRPGGSRCVRERESHRLGPMSPYLPSGLWG